MIPTTYILAFALAAPAAVVAVLIARQTLEPETTLSQRARILLGALTAIAVASLPVWAGTMRASSAVSTAGSVTQSGAALDPSRPLMLVALAAVVTVACATLATDNARSVFHFAVHKYAAPLVAIVVVVLLTVDRLNGGPGSAAAATVGLVGVGGLAFLIGRGGRFYAHLRGLDRDPLTGDVCDDFAFGDGDILLALVIGSILGLALGFAAFMGAMIASGLAGGVILVARHLRHDPEFMPAMPLGPFLIGALTLALAFGA